MLYVELDLATNCIEIPWGLFLRLSADQVQNMSKPFIVGDVLRALKAMAPLKALGPYGYHAYFFQKYWDLVGGPICEIVVGILRGREIPEGLNENFISLIPKVSSP